VGQFTRARADGNRAAAGHRESWLGWWPGARSPRPTRLSACRARRRCSCDWMRWRFVKHRHFGVSSADVRGKAGEPGKTKPIFFVAGTSGEAHRGRAWKRQCHSSRNSRPAGTVKSADSCFISVPFCRNRFAAHERHGIRPEKTLQRNPAAPGLGDIHFRRVGYTLWDVRSLMTGLVCTAKLDQRILGKPPGPPIGLAGRAALCAGRNHGWSQPFCTPRPAPKRNLGPKCIAEMPVLICTALQLCSVTPVPEKVHRPCEKIGRSPRVRAAAVALPAGRAGGTVLLVAVCRRYIGFHQTGIRWNENAGAPFGSSKTSSRWRMNGMENIRRHAPASKL